MWIDVATVENSMEVPQKTKMEPAYDPAISLQNVWETMKTLMWKDTQTPVFTAVLFIWHDNQDMEATQVSINRQMD